MQKNSTNSKINFPDAKADASHFSNALSGPPLYSYWRPLVSCANEILDDFGIAFSAFYLIRLKR